MHERMRREGGRKEEGRKGEREKGRKGDREKGRESEGGANDCEMQLVTYLSPAMASDLESVESNPSNDS
jgi:hypothetical protein